MVLLAFQNVAAYLDDLQLFFGLPLYVQVAALMIMQDLLESPHGLPDELKPWRVLVTVSTLLASKVCLEEVISTSDILRLTKRNPIETLTAAESAAVLHMWGDRDALSTVRITRRLGSFRAAMLQVLLKQPELHGYIRLDDVDAVDPDTPPVEVLIVGSSATDAAAQRELLLQLSPLAATTTCLSTEAAVQHLSAIAWSPEQPLPLSPRQPAPTPAQAATEPPAAVGDAAAAAEAAAAAAEAAATAADAHSDADTEAAPTARAPRRPTLLLVQLGPDGAGLGADEEGGGNAGEAAGGVAGGGSPLDAPGIQVVDALHGFIDAQPSEPLEPGAPLVVAVSAQVHIGGASRRPSHGPV